MEYDLEHRFWRQTVWTWILALPRALCVILAQLLNPGVIHSPCLESGDKKTHLAEVPWRFSSECYGGGTHGPVPGLFWELSEHWFSSLPSSSLLSLLSKRGHVTTLGASLVTRVSDICSAHFAVGIWLQITVKVKQWNLHNLCGALQMRAPVIVIFQSMGNAIGGTMPGVTAGGLAFHHLSLCLPFSSCSRSSLSKSLLPPRGSLPVPGLEKEE